MFPPRSRTPARAAALVAALLAAAAPAWAMGDPVIVEAAPLPLDPERPELRRVGELAYCGGLYLWSRDARFGGYSGARLIGDGTELLAVSDAGTWLTARLRFAGGRLIGFEDARIAPLLNRKGAPYSDKRRTDAEGLAILDGELVVSFERRHRMRVFADPEAPARRFKGPKAITGLRSNSGVEAVAALGRGRLLAIPEGREEKSGPIEGWLRHADGRWRSLYVKRRSPFRPTDMVALPGGDVALLERRFSRLGGPGMAIRLIPAAAVAAGALLDGPVLVDLNVRYSIDNMEALAMRQAPGGAVQFLIMSDDNFNVLQRTLILCFEMRRPPPSLAAAPRPKPGTR